MKRVLLIFSAMMIFASWGYAQQRKELKGPEAKNYKPWKDNSEKSIAVYKVNPERLTGPEAKNKKPWDKSPKPAQYMAITTSSQPKLQGPKAKNWKPWYSDQPTKKVYVETTSDETMPEEKKTENGETNHDNP